MNGLIQSAVASRGLAVVQPESIQDASFPVPFDTDGKLAKFYQDLSKEIETDTPIYRATVGLGGSRDFNVRTGMEEMDTSSPRICGIILYAHDFNVYFDEDLPGEPPVCTAIDGITGANRLTGETCSCADCPKNRRVDGRKECRNKVRLYVLTEGTPVPLAIDVPPASLIVWKNFRRSLRHFGYLEPQDVLTEFVLEAAQNANKIKYSKIKMKVIGKLDKDTAEKVEWIRQNFVPDMTVELTDFTEVQDA